MIIKKIEPRRFRRYANLTIKENAPIYRCHDNYFEFVPMWKAGTYSANQECFKNGIPKGPWIIHRYNSVYSYKIRNEDIDDNLIQIIEMDKSMVKIYGWTEQNEVAGGVRTKEWHSTEPIRLENGEIFSNDVPEGRWFISYKHAKAACIIYWENQKRVAINALKIIRSKRELDGNNW